MGAANSKSRGNKASDDNTAYLFLDVDGVLNSGATRVGAAPRLGAGDVPDNGHLPAPALLDQLVSICDRAAPITIILSSTWRLDAGLTKAIKQALGSRGLSISSSTLDLRGIGAGDRVDEILLELTDRGLHPQSDFWCDLSHFPSNSASFGGSRGPFPCCIN